MSQGDKVDELLTGFEIIGTRENSPFSAIANEAENIYLYNFTQKFTIQFKVVNYLKTLQNIFVNVNQLGTWVLLLKSKLTTLKNKLDLKKFYVVFLVE